MEVDSWLTGRRGISLPFTDEFEPLCADDGLCRATFDQVLSHAERRRWKYYELRGGRSRLSDLPPSLSFHGHTLALQPDPAKVFARCYGSARTAVRKAEQAGLTVEFSQSMEATQMFHQLLCQTRSRHGAPPQPLGFFANIQREILAASRGWIVLARLGAKAVGGAVFFHFGRTALYKFAASDSAFRHLQANNLVLWRAIEHYARNGFSSLDFGRTSLDNEGLRRFKLAWGADERRIEYVRCQPGKRVFLTSADRSSGWQRLVFRSLPPVLSRSVGAMIYRHFA